MERIQDLSSENVALKKRLDEAFNDQQDRIRTVARFNRPSLRLAARRTFAPIWSARRHPIYRLIEIAYEEQRLRLRPKIDKLIEERIVIHVLNFQINIKAILEEINKTLKSLVPSIPSQWHWEIAAVIIETAY